MGKLNFRKPVDNGISDVYGRTRKNGRTHYGIDFEAPEGTEVHASAAPWRIVFHPAQNGVRKRAGFNACPLTRKKRVRLPSA